MDSIKIGHTVFFEQISESVLISDIQVLNEQDASNLPDVDEETFEDLNVIVFYEKEDGGEKLEGWLKLDLLADII